MNKKVTKEELYKLMIEERNETIENYERFYNNHYGKKENIKPLQSKAFLKLVNKTIEYLEQL